MIVNHETEYFSRWADAQFDGSMDGVDRAIAAMTQFALVAQAADDPAIAQSARHEVSRAAGNATSRLQAVLALHAGRVTHVPFPPGFVLVAAIGRTLPNVSHAVRRAVEDGANLAERPNAGLLESADLSDEELAYRVWATPLLLRHLYDDSLD